MKIRNYYSYLLLILCFSNAWADHGNPNHTSTPQKKPVYVIVHGAWGGSWAFGVIDSILTARGNIVYRPSLTGQGERAHLGSPEIGLNTHIEDVVNMILFEKLDDIILVGHSYGGMVITGVADRIPDRIKKLVYLDAFVPNDGESVTSMQGERGAWLKDMIKDGFIVPAWVKADQLPPKDVPQSAKTFSDAVRYKNPAAKKLPAAYILTVDPGKKPEEDNFFPSSQRAKERGWKIYEMAADHNPQWSAPEALATMLLRDL